MKTAFWFSCLWLVVCSCKMSRQEFYKGNVDSVPRILVYGLQDLVRRNAEDLLSRKYGFAFLSVAGCAVTNELIDSVKKENEEVWALLNRKYGEGFSKQFQREVDSEYVKLKSVLTLVKKQPYIQLKEKAVIRRGSYLFYNMNWTDQKTVYDVIVYGFVAVRNDTQWQKYFNLKVDAEANIVQVVNDKVEPY